MGKKRVVKMDVGYLEFLIDALRLINKSSEETVKAICGKTKAESLEAWISGLEATLENAKENK